MRFKHLLVDGLSQHSDAALQGHPFPSGAHVLDVGCGFGDSTVRIAEQVGPEGDAIGVDCAENFIEAARQDASASHAGNARFEVRDVEWDDLGGPYDHAFSRFGTMFFAMPGAAMRNVRKSLQPGGTFTQVVWRKREDNPWLHEAELRVKSMVPVVSHEDTDAVHCGPGPFSMAGADMVSDLLTGSGFSRITFERHDCDICIGRDIDDAVAFAKALGPAGEIIRLAGDLAEACMDEVDVALRETFAPYLGEHGVWAPSSTWIIRAQA
ncbi:class I SAM-dependent methyltransferase [Oleiagrimonas soli]|uniref:SAM-dependent methyltransferase n=1 Tax=Oleiagrimonas soli TaxID=1543381 RepID=A0A841KKA4_9GAMM|nr:class I SAM-dependent methyltransferase [Oleiagrimonas soli]MBB6183071.1 SAM-dependent methyltransferase [Oleiagrimonas soli]